MVKPTQYMMSENENTLKSLFLKVAVKDLKTFSLDGFGSIKSVSFKRNVGSNNAINATTARKMKQIRYAQANPTTSINIGATTNGK